MEHGITRVVIADAHPLEREGIESLLASEPGMRVVADVSDGAEAVRVVRRLLPDVLILDISIPKSNGVEIIPQILGVSPGTRIVVLSVHTAGAYVRESLRNGAGAYVIKDVPLDNLVLAIKEVCAGRRFVSPPLPKSLLHDFDGELPVPDADLYKRLTAREREVLELVVAGMSSPAIGEQLHISHRTVEQHRARIVKKLGLSGMSSLVRFGTRRDSE